VRDAEKPRGGGEAREKSIRVLGREEIQGFLEAVQSPKYRTLFMLAITSGARQGELLGLKWPDVDWKNRQIHIQRTFNNGAWFDTKSKASCRRVDLGPATMDALKGWLAVCPESALGLVFPNEAGNPVNHNNMVRRHFQPALKAAGLPLIRFHDLRHTYASLLIDQGENIKYIQSQLGHSSPTVTLNVYAHLMSPVNQESARRLDSSLFGATGNNLGTIKAKGVPGKPGTP
ncbi:MAG: site-specific integrase, partial [Pseudomonadota bacterium]